MAFEEIKKLLGFGCMRLPMKGLKVDTVEFTKMVDTFINNGFNYFDTSHVYIGGQSEKAIKTCLTSRYPRDKYILTDKLTSSNFFFRWQIKPLIKKMLKACGVDYFDILLMHAQNASNYAKYTRLKAYETAYSLKSEGLIRHFGISFHDKADVLDRILNDHPEIEVVQLQFNYLDVDDPKIDTKRCYDICVKHGKPVIVMEPVKGGVLAKLPPEANEIVSKLNSGSPASLAIRYASGYNNVINVLSGMSNMQQLNDNISFMQNFKPLDNAELRAIQEIKSILTKQDLIKCTGCRYCVDGCPKDIPIPDIFRLINNKKGFKDKKAESEYCELIKNTNSPSACIKCGKCENICPQMLPIRELLITANEEIKK